MKNIIITACISCVLLFACNNEKKTDEAKPDKDTTQATTPDVKKDEPTPMLDSATMMNNMQSYGTPGDPQKMLAKAAGTWTAEIKGWLVPGGAPNYSSKGTTINKMILGGRYQESVSTANMMGMPFEGRGIIGYDNAKKIYQSSWVDNMGTGIMNMEGTWDDATKSITFKGRAVDAATMKEADFKEIFKIIDDNNQVLEMYGPGPDGKGYKMMEIKYKRK